MIISTPRGQGGPEVMHLTEAPVPQPDAHEVRIRVTAAGVNRADLLQRQGHYPPPAGAPAWPGLEAAGIVDAVGDHVTDWHVGEPACALLAGGGYAEFVTVDARHALRPPLGLDLADAAGLMEAACTVWSTLQAADARPGETLLVHGGSGGIGTFAVAWAAARGMRVIATAGGPERTRRVAALGAEHVIDYRSEDFAEAVTDLGGADVILDVIGADYLSRNLASLKTGGRLAIIGLLRGARGELDLGELLRKRARVIGTTLRSREPADKARIVAGVAADVWPLVPHRVTPQIHARLPLAHAAEAHRLLESGEVFGTLVLTVGD